MKRAITIFMVLLIFSQLSAQESPNYPYRNAIKLGIPELGNSQFQFGYERFFGDRKSSIIIMPSFILKKNADEELGGFELAAQYRFMLSNHKDAWFLNNISFYGAPYAQYLTLTSENAFYKYVNGVPEPLRNIAKRDINAIEGGLLIGAHMDLTSRINLDFFVGGGVRYSDVTDSGDQIEGYPYSYYYSVFDREYTGIKPRIGLMMGISF